MKTTTSHWVCIVAMLFAPTLMADGEYKLSDPELIESVAQYKSAVKEAREKMLPNFEKVIKSIRMNNSIAAGERIKMVADLEQHRDEFVEVGTIPNSSGVLSYTDQFVKKPRADWHDIAKSTIQLDPENTGRLNARWEVDSGQSGSVVLISVPQ